MIDTGVSGGIELDRPRDDRGQPLARFRFPPSQPRDISQPHASSFFFFFAAVLSRSARARARLLTPPRLPEGILTCTRDVSDLGYSFFFFDAIISERMRAACARACHCACAPLLPPSLPPLVPCPRSSARTGAGLGQRRGRDARARAATGGRRGAPSPSTPSPPFCCRRCRAAFAVRSCSSTQGMRCARAR